MELSPLQKERQALPIYKCKKQISEFIFNESCLICVGETGSGKSTQLPQYVLELYPEVSIACTQPRRVAATTLADRVSKECRDDGKDGVVGYKIRFEDQTDKNTQITFLTDGMLLRESQVDPLLKKYNVIILDEAHERTLHTDILFGIIKRIKQKREDLKIIVMSATLEAQTFSKFFFDCKILYISGRQYPVNIFYTKVPEKDYMDACIRAVLQVHIEQPTGPKTDILVFLTGQDEILGVQDVLESKAKYLPQDTDKMIIRPLFSALPHQKQMEAFEQTPPGCRKVILATNIAETSLTISGIKYVIDCGLVKQRFFQSSNHIEWLQVIPISRANAKQRTGRAGREQEGTCYRLYTEEQFFQQMDRFQKPEILRCDLSTVMLQMKSMGINDLVKFPFLSSPTKESLEKSLQNLFVLGALNKGLKITNLGKQMAKFPLSPIYSLTLLKATEYGCVQEILTILSMLSIQNIFYNPIQNRSAATEAKRKFSSKYGDHLTLLYVWNAYHENKGSQTFCRQHFINEKKMRIVQDVRKQLKRYCEQLHIKTNSTCGKNYRTLRKCLLAGGFTQLAFRMPKSRTYKILRSNMEALIHPSSVLQELPERKLPEFVIFNVCLKTNQLYLRELSVIERDWLTEINLDSEYFEGKIPRPDLNDVKRKLQNSRVVRSM